MDLGSSLGLAFSSGINAYLPLLSLAIAANFWPGHFKINPEFGFITQPWFMVLMAILTVADLVADKIPVVDHIWDAIHTVIRPVAGALVAAAAAGVHVNGGWLPIILALGAGLAAVTHTTKAATRATSSVTTAGMANPFISIGEDILMVLGVLLSLIAPYVMLIIVILFVGGFLLLLPRIVRTIQRRRQRRLKSMPAASQHMGRRY